MRAIEQPPLSDVLRYRLLGRRVRESSLAWVEHDIRSDGWLRRQLRAQAIVMFCVYVVVTALFAVFARRFSIDALTGGLTIPIIWVVLLGAQYVLAPRVERSDHVRRQRARMLAVQRGERPQGWTTMDDGRGGPFIFWAIGAFALAAVITVVVRALT